MNTYQDTLKWLIESITEFNKTDILVIESSSGQVYTYEDVYEKANQVGTYLKKQNIEEIIICAENGFELFTLYFATMFFNITIIPIDPEKSDEEIEKIKNYHSSAIFYTEADIKKIFMTSKTISETKCMKDVDFYKTYLITYTSGSTGIPKGVKHSVANLFLAALEFGTLMQYDAKTVMCHVMPMTYMAGILNTIFLPYIMGGAIVLMPRFSMKSAFSFWETVEKYQINTFWLTPMMLRILDMLDRKGSMKEYLHTVNAKISVGTAPLDNTLRARVETKYGISIYQSYGLSETLFVSTETPGRLKSNNSVGMLLQGVQIHFAEDNEILISVPWMFHGYLDAHDIKSEECYHSGDLGKIIDGELYIQGRKKDLIIKGGFNINPKDIENIMKEKELAEECCVFSLTLRGEENIICCYTGNKKQEINDINIIIQHTLGKKYRLDILEKVQEIPRNLNGKIDKNKLRNIMEQKYDCKN